MKGRVLSARYLSMVSRRHFDGSRVTHPRGLLPVRPHSVREAELFSFWVSGQTQRGSYENVSNLLIRGAGLTTLVLSAWLNSSFGFLGERQESRGIIVNSGAGIG